MNIHQIKSELQSLKAKTGVLKKLLGIHNPYAGKGRKITRLIARDGPRCHWCQRVTNPNLPQISPLRSTVDHLIRRADGGSNDMENLVVACRQCNSSRHGPNWIPTRFRNE